MRLGSALVVAVVFSGAAGGCASWRQASGGGASSRALATRAIRTALDSGAFEAMVEQVTDRASAVARARFEASGQPLSAEQASRLQKAIREVVVEVYPREAWEEALLPLYLDNLDRDELRALLAFQRSRLGGKMQLLQARLMDTRETSQELLRSRQEEFARRLTQALTTVLQGTTVK